MKTFSVPLTLGVVAEDEAQAVEIVSDFLEGVLSTPSGIATVKYCDVTAEHDVVEQVNTIESVEPNVLI